MSDTPKLAPFAEISESFGALFEKGVYYVDKTDFITYLIEQIRNICVFTRPRRFGKTLMLRTLQTFFEYRLDDDGKPVDNRRYFEGLKVMDAGENVLKHFGQYPVISLSLKNMRNDSFDDMLAKLKAALGKACQPHKYLLNSPELSPMEKERFSRILDRVITQAECEDALGDMCDWIQRATKRKTVILIDEYDVPLQKAAIHDMHHPGDNLFDKTVSLVGNFISSGYKSNDNLAFGIIAGCMRVAKESIFTGMNNPGVITVVDRIPNEFWGFTPKEVEDMLAYYNLSDQMDALKNWYDGYYYSGREVYNPWSLLNAIRGLVNGDGDDAVQAYWSMTSSNDIIDDMIDNHPEYREELAKLMEGGSKWVKVYKDLSYRDLQTRPDAIWSFLLFTGYLKSLTVRKNDDDLLEAEIAIPNREILTVMKSAMRNWWENKHLAHYNAKPLVQALCSGDVAGIEREINAIMNNSISVKDAKEDFYHGMLVGVLNTQCIVKSNRESGEGFPDIIAIEGNQAAILELKCLLASELEKIPKNERYSRVPGMMQNLLDEAETQIKTRKYTEGLRFEYPIVTEVKSYAICFCRKMCKVRAIEE